MSVIDCATKIDSSHLISKEQIDIVKKCTKKGDFVSFHKDGMPIEGTVSGVYDHIFTLLNGRSFTFVDYIIGSPEILTYLRSFHPIEEINYDPTTNYFVYRMMRAD